jgi:putative Mn2+ efflux pump MntP
MDWSFSFIFSSLMLGVGLAMDAFSVSLANGLNEPKMKKRRMLMIAGTFAFFQALMPFVGWVCVHTVVQYFQSFEKFIPWIALILLCAIGGKMIWDGIHEKECPCGEGEMTKLCVATLMLQGVATSIDALSVGFQIASYNLLQAIACALLIAAVTFFICFGGVVIGRKFGTAFAGKAGIFGGLILVFIGAWIFIQGML